MRTMPSARAHRSIKRLGAMLKKFYDAWYAPNNAILVVVGDVQPAQVLAQIKMLFSGIPPKKLPARPEIHMRPMAAEMFQSQTDLPYGLAVTAFRMPGSKSPDYAAAQVLGDVLSSQRGDLYALVPQGKALSAGFSVNGLPDESLGYAVAAFPKGADSKTVEQQVRQVLAGYLKNGFPAELVEASKRQEVTGAELEKNSVSGLAMAWSQAVAIDGRNSPDEELREIQRVTVADVDRVARKYLTLDTAASITVTRAKPGPCGLKKRFCRACASAGLPLTRMVSGSVPPDNLRATGAGPALPSASSMRAPSGGNRICKPEPPPSLR